MNRFRNLFPNYLPLIIFISTVLIFFYPVFLSFKIPIAADSIVGLYHPYRDNIWNNLTSGVPVKNPLITDPVRQQYVWRSLSLENLKSGFLPTWNPYSFGGTPLAANFQSAAFYPLNVLFIFIPLNAAWIILIMSQSLLLGLFMYAYLRFLKVTRAGSLIGALAFSFSGFTIAWLTWNTVIHTILWLPLILLSKEHLLKKLNTKWIAILIFAEISQILAGHLQVLFYSLLVSNLYLIVRILQINITSKRLSSIILNSLKTYLPFFIIGIFVFLITFIQWFPTLKFINLSSRTFDQGDFTKPGWFIPPSQLIQFVVPDFFGNPATNNYWGEWNYGEFIGFIGIVPLICAFSALLFRRDKKVLFFGSLAIISLVFSLPTFLARLPFELSLPFISTSQPTRLLVLVDFALCILSALGFDHLRKSKGYKELLLVLFILLTIFLLLWIFILNPRLLNLDINPANVIIAQRNLIFPTFIFLISALYFLLLKSKLSFKYFFISLIIATMILELLRFSWKFTPFSTNNWLFPQTKILTKLQNEVGNWRFMALDRRIMPPNFSVHYHLLDVSGYDPLYLRRYGELAAAWGRGVPDIGPAPFNRIITPQDYSSPFADLLGVKYILSLKDELSLKLKIIDREGETRLYENTRVLPRAFLVKNVLQTDSDQGEMEKLFSISDRFLQIATSQDSITLDSSELTQDESAQIISYKDSIVIIKTFTNAKRLLVLTDVYYPTWKVFVDKKETKLYRVDYTLRGVVVPAGSHKIEFKNYLF